LDLDIEITERDVNAEYFHDTNLPFLNTMQWQIYDTITDCIREDIGNFISLMHLKVLEKLFS